MSSSSPERAFAATLARKAAEDLKALIVLTEREGIADAILGFHAQQAVEKALKALLVSEGWELRRTHDLKFLIEQTEAVGLDLPDAVGAAHWLTPWAAELRYDEFSEEQLDRERAVHAATEAVELANRQVGSA